MGKLVRDRIPEIIKGDGQIPIVRKLNKKEFQTVLKKKLAEEVREVVSAKSRDSLIEELADIQEVMLGIYDAFDIKCEDVTRLASKKRKHRGGFSKRIFLESIKKNKHGNSIHRTK